jgi:hypothetical protein
LRPERRRLNLVGGQHQRGQIEPVLQHIADTRLTAHRHALADQRGDVAIDRSLRGLELGGDRARGHWAALAAEDLDDLEQAVGASHGPLSTASMLTPCCQ